MLLVAGHLYLSLLAPSTRHSLRGMLHGTVRESWAREHHPKWAGASRAAPVREGWPRSGVGRFLIGLAVLVAASGTYAAVRPRSAARATASAFPPAPVPPAIARGSALTDRALALDQSGDVASALPLYAQAVQTLPAVASIRTYYGSALARTGHSLPAIVQLREAVRLGPSLPAARLYLGALLQRSGQRAQARFQLRHAVALDPAGPTGAAARQLLGR